MTDGKFVSVMTNTFASEITYEEWKKKIENFFFSDERVIMLLKQNGMTKYTIYKTDDVEPVKSGLKVNAVVVSIKISTGSINSGVIDITERLFVKLDFILSLTIVFAALVKPSLKSREI